MILTSMNQVILIDKLGASLACIEVLKHLTGEVGTGYSAQDVALNDY